MANLSQVENMTANKLLDIVNDKNQTKDMRAAARRELSKRSMGQDTTKPVTKMSKGGYGKKKMAKGGYANCGASSPATQASTVKMNQGGLLKPNNPGLKKLPKPVRNKMGYMASGGYAKKK